MDLLQMKYFQAVARLEHMTRAAEELGIAQPSLSKTIARLEEELGVPLFDRQGRQIQLNRFGKAFLKRVERIFYELREGQREIADLAGLEGGHISLASALSTSLLADILSVFCVNHPRVSFKLFQQSSLTTLKQLESGAIDLCITSPPIEKPGVCWVPLANEEVVLLVPPEHRLSERSSIRLQEVADEPFISPKPGNSLRDLIDEACRQAGFTLNVVFEGDEPGAIYGLVRAGIGLTFLPVLTWKSSTMPIGTLLHIEEPVCQRTIGIAWQEDRYLPRAVHDFREFVIEYFARLKEDAYQLTSRE